MQCKCGGIIYKDECTKCGQMYVEDQMGLGFEGEQESALNSAPVIDCLGDCEWN